MEPDGQQANAGEKPFDQRRRALACRCCRSNTYEDVVKAAFWSDRGLIAIEDIPARVCEACGEQFYEEKTAHKIERLLADPPARARQQTRVPVFSLTEVDVPRRASRPEGLNEPDLEAIERTFSDVGPAAEPTGEDQGPREALPCRYCQSNTREQIVKSVLWSATGWVAIEDVPARVCEGCREPFYDDETARKIDKLIEYGFPAEKARREILAPVFSLAEIEASRRPADRTD